MNLSNNKYFGKINNKYIYDSLTHVLNRENTLNYIKYLIDKKEKFTLLFIDIDYFKDINDSLGHKAGDAVLKNVSSILLDATTDDSICGRFGGDEFIIVNKNLDTYEKTWNYCRNICRKVTNNSLPIGVNFTNITVTIGTAEFPKDASNYNELFEIVDKVLYRGKIKGRNCFVIYNKALHENVKKNELSILNTEQLIQFIFNEMGNNSISLDNRLSMVINFIVRYYNIDYVSKCINNDFEIIYVEETSKLPDHKEIPQYVYNKAGFNELPIYVINFKSNLKETDNDSLLYNELAKQNIKAEILAYVSTKNHKYGYLRFDLKHERVWQKEIRVLIQVIANCYAKELELAE